MGITLYTRWPLWVRGKAAAAFDIKHAKKWKFDDLTKVRQRRRLQLSRDVHHLNPEINRKGSTKKSWVGKEVGTKTMWVPLVRGACIYGAHMARNITANNTTNTCAFPQHPPHQEKKNSNKCHPTQSRGSETARQINKQSFGLRRESSTRKMSPASLFGLFFFIIIAACNFSCYSPALCMKCAVQLSKQLWLFIFFSCCTSKRRLIGCVKKK